MISDISSGRLKAVMLAAGFGLALVLPARADPPAAPIWPTQQADPADEADEPDAPADKPATADANDPDMKDIDVSKLDWSQLNTDPAAIAEAKARAASKQAPGSGGMDWSSHNDANGSSAVSVKQSVSPFWDARVGADMTVTHEATTMSELLAEKSTNGGNLPQSGGSAWAAVTAPGAGSLWDKTAVEARIDPGSDQSKLGTTISKQVPLANQSAITLQNGYNMTEQGTAPVPGLGDGRTTRSYGTDQSATVDIGGTGASITAGQSLSSNDDKWMRKFGAEQKLGGGVTVSGSVSETPQGTTNKSITAGFKKSW